MFNIGFRLTLKATHFLHSVNNNNEEEIPNKHPTPYTIMQYSRGTPTTLQREYLSVSPSPWGDAGGIFRLYSSGPYTKVVSFVDNKRMGFLFLPSDF